MSRALALPGVDVLSALVPGSKRAEGERGDDVVKVGSFGSTALVALADGAGSASRGGYGAELAALSALESACEQIEAGGQGVRLEGVLTRAMHEARSTLLVAARASVGGEDPIAPRDLATTLAIAAFGREQIGVASIGDGIQVLRRTDGELALVAMAPDTEIANHTDFLTGPDVASRTEVEVHPAGEIESVLLSSDGLDSQLLDRRDGERWPQHATVTALMNAPLLEGWGPSEFEALLGSALIRRHSDDDLSLALMRRVEEPVGRSLRAGRLTLKKAAEVRPGCRTWTVDGCSSLLAIAPDPPLPADVEIAAPAGQILDRGSRYAPINWPVRRIDHELILVQRLPRRAPLARGTFSRSDGAERAEILAGVRACVDALHASALSHGRLSLDSFALYPDRTVVLWEPGPGMFDDADQEALASLDRSFLSDLSSGSTGAAPPPVPFPPPRREP